MKLRIKFILYFNVLTLILIGGLLYFLHINIENEIKYFIFGGLIIWLIGVITAYFFSGIFLKDIFSINKVATEVANNNLTARVNINSKDEIGYLAEIFNNMLDNVRDTQKKIREAEIKLKETNLNLERRIHDRTEDLIKLKNNLEIIVFERTKELQEKLAELEKFKELTVGRELKMIELKKKLKELQRE